MKKKMVISFIVIFLIIIVLFGFIKIKNKREYNNELLQNQIVQNQIELSEREANYKQEDEEKPEEINNVEIDETKQILGCMILGEFNNSGVLTEEELLAVIYNLINGDIVKINNNSITKQEVNDLIYKMFNRSISDNVNIDNMQYSDGKYIVTKKSKDIGKITDEEYNVAAGTALMSFEYNSQRYIARFATNTVTGERYIQSIKKD